MGAGLSCGSCISIPSLKINLGLESIGTRIDGKSNTYVSADVMDIFVDSLNSWMMKKVGSNYPDIYVMTRNIMLCKLLVISCWL